MLILVVVVFIAHLNVTDTATEKRHAARNVIPCRRSMTTFDPLSDDIEINKNDSFSF